MITKVKSSKILYKLYSIFGNFFFIFLRKVYKKKENIILFSSFGGKSVDDSPRILFEAMRNDYRYSNYKLIWALSDPSSHQNRLFNVVKIDSLKFYILCIKSKVWITNSSMQRGLKIKDKSTIYLNTWHGTPLKHMGKDIISLSESFNIREDKVDVDIFLVQSMYEKEIFKKAYGLQDEIFLENGLPRNDELISPISNEVINEIRKKLHIAVNSKVILYAPTFRMNGIDKNGKMNFDPNLNFNTFLKELGEDVTLLIRGHYESSIQLDDVAKNAQVIDVSNYPNINELFKVSDMLISDYSSVFFDFSITEKPMIAYLFDYEEYNLGRGMYFDIRKYIDYSQTQEGLVEMIRNELVHKKSEKTILFRNKFVDWYGNSTTSALDKVYNELTSKEK